MSRLASISQVWSKWNNLCPWRGLKEVPFWPFFFRTPGDPARAWILQQKSSMRRIFIILFGMVALLGWAAVYPCDAQTDWPTQEQALFHLINQARQNPLETAKAMGLDTEKLLMDLPELKDIFLNGLPPLVYNERLQGAASAHTNDMVFRGYYSHISKDGRTLEQRILDAGYLASASGEALGMLSFNNYLQPSAAVDALFRNIFKDELRSERKEKRNILSADLEDVGIGMASGVIVLGGSRLNVYLATCDFGKSGIAVLEEQFMNLINEARRDPLAMAESLGLNREKILSDLPEFAEVLKAGLAPLEFNRQLKNGSDDWLAGVMEKGFVFSGTGRDPSAQERLVAQGYLPLAAADSIGITPLEESVASTEAITNLFVDFFMAELDPGRTDDRLILDDGLKEVGVALSLGDVALRQGGTAVRSYAVAFMAGTDAAPQVEAELMLLINRARANPTEMIKEAGFDPDQIIRDHPWFGDIRTKGLPDFWNNEKLHTTAVTHTLDMSGRNYFSSVNPEGKDYRSRIEAAGYEASAAGEALGVAPYMMQSPAEIAWELFRIMLADELDTAGNTARLIFDPDFTEVGIGIGGGDFSLDGLYGNFALATIDFAARASGESPREAAEILFLELVNEARADPLRMAAALGCSPDVILALVRGWGEEALSGLEAVYLNEKLWSAAIGHVDDMIVRGYYSHFTLPEGSVSIGSDAVNPPGGPFRPGPYGKGFRDRILEQGYVPMVCGEFLGAWDITSEPYPEGAVVALFREQFLLEITPGWGGERLILNPDFQELGIGLSAGTVVIEGESRNAYVITVEFATSYDGVEGSLFGLSY